MSQHIQYSSLGFEYFMIKKILFKVLNLVYLTSYENIIFFLSELIIVKLTSYHLLENNNFLIIRYNLLYFGL